MHASRSVWSDSSRASSASDRSGDLSALAARVTRHVLREAMFAFLSCSVEESQTGETVVACTSVGVVTAVSAASRFIEILWGR